jgi:hypothetical protein
MHTLWLLFRLLDLVFKVDIIVDVTVSYYMYMSHFNLKLNHLMFRCREIYKRVCVAGYDPSVVESPTEPKWSSDGT